MVIPTVNHERQQHMATKAKTHRKQNSNQRHETHQAHQAAESVTGMADTARKNYEHAIRTGKKFQEEAGEWWTRMLTQTTTATDWQKNFTRFTAIAGNAVPMAQRCLQGAMDVMEKSSRNGADLLRKAVDAAQTPSFAESQAKWLEFWTSSMKAAQNNVEAVTHLGTRTIDSWIDFVRETSNSGEHRPANAV